MKILVTGGCGYIGSHTCCELLSDDYEVVIIDNLSNSKKDVIDKIEKITSKKVKFYEGNVQDEKLLKLIFTENKIDGVIHFAGYKAVGESVKKPLMYYDNNINSTLVLLKIMAEFECKNIVFSSSATVYGIQKSPKYVETMARGVTSSPYGSTKAMIEKIMEDLYTSDSSWTITLLRYFNPVGADRKSVV